MNSEQVRGPDLARRQRRSGLELRFRDRSGVLLPRRKLAVVEGIMEVRRVTAGRCDGLPNPKMKLKAFLALPGAALLPNGPYCPTYLGNG